MHSFCKKEALLNNNRLMYSNYICITKMLLLCETKQKSLLLKPHHICTENKTVMTFNISLFKNNLQDQENTAELSYQSLP